MIKALEIRKTAESRWEVFHLPTGLKIPPSLEEVEWHYGKNKKREVMAFYNRIRDAFPWHEWQAVDKRPAWAEAAYQLIKYGYESKNTQA